MPYVRPPSWDAFVFHFKGVASGKVEPPILWLSGGEGVGKSRLLSEASTAEGVPLVRACCTPHRFEGWAPVRALGHRLGIAVAPVGTGPAGAATVQRGPHLVNEVLRAFRERLRTRACALVLEDLQWVSPEILRFVETLCRSARTEAGRFGVVLTARSFDGDLRPLLDRSVEEGTGTYRQLLPLPFGAVRRLVEASGRKGLTEDRLKRWHRATGGTPVVVLEMVRSAGLGSRDGRMDARALLAARVRALPASLGNVVEILAVAGEPLVEGVLAETARTAMRAVRGRLHKLFDAGLVSREDGGGWVIEGETLRAVVREGLSLSRRRSLARRLIRSIERSLGPRAGEAGLLLFHLAGKADDRTRRFRYGILHGRRLREEGAVGTAGDLVESLRRENPRGEVRADLWCLRIETARDASDLRAIRRWDPRRIPDRAFETFARAVLDVGMVEDLRDLLPVLRGRPGAEWLRAHVEASIALAEGDAPRASRLAARTLRAARRSGDARIEIAALNLLGTIRYQEGDDVESIRLTRRAWERARREGERAKEVASFREFAALAIRLGRPRRARRFAERSERGASEQGFLSFRIAADEILAYLDGLSGDYESCLDRVARMKGDAERAGLEEGVFGAERNRALALVSLGRVEEARFIQQRLLLDPVVRHSVVRESILRSEYGMTLGRAGSLREGLAQVEKSISCLKGRGYGRIERSACLVAAALCVDAGESDAAGKWLGRAKGIGIDDVVGRIRIGWVEGMLAKDGREVIGLLEKGLAAAARMEDVEFLRRFHAKLAECHRKRGDVREALRHAEEAAACVRRVADGLSSGNRERYLGVPGHAEALELPDRIRRDTGATGRPVDRERDLREGVRELARIEGIAPFLDRLARVASGVAGGGRCVLSWRRTAGPPPVPPDGDGADGEWVRLVDRGDVASGGGRGGFRREIAGGRLLLEIPGLHDRGEILDRLGWLCDVAGPLFDRLLDRRGEASGTDRDGIEGGSAAPPWIGTGEISNRLLAQTARLAETDLPVLLEGETGTGKELLARRLHFQSRRRGGPFVAVNCATGVEGLLESQLFGHEKGAFTGADRLREGIFEQADGGTLFLDEVAEMSGSLQAKLLRVLQDGVFRRVGGQKELRVDVRIVAATHRDLEEEVASGGFRQDLFYRLVVARLAVPPLRERTEDFPELVRAFLRDPEVTVDPDAMARMKEHAWPGNVRELTNEVARWRLEGLRRVGIEDLSPAVRTGRERSESSATVRLAGRSFEDLERLALRDALRRTGGNKSEAARVLGISRFTLYAKLRKYGDET